MHQGEPSNDSTVYTGKRKETVPGWEVADDTGLVEGAPSLRRMWVNVS
jgi:hypothetical protein